MAVPLRDWAIAAGPDGPCRSSYRVWAPRPAAAPAVRHSWTASAGWARSLRLLPDGCADLVWDGRELTAVAVGPEQVRLAVTTAGRVGIRLRCGAAGGLLGPAATESGALAVPLTELLGPRARRTEDALARSATSAEQRAVLEELVADLLRTGRAPDPAVAEAVRRLASPTARVDHISDELGTSSRTLRRMVRAAVGLGPKELQRVLRFQGFLRHLPDLAAERIGSAGAAAALGYADQAHLGRECRRMSGSTPAALVRTWSQPMRGTAGTSPRPGGRNLPDRPGGRPG